MRADETHDHDRRVPEQSTRDSQQLPLTLTEVGSARRHLALQRNGDLVRRGSNAVGLERILDVLSVKLDEVACRRHATGSDRVDRRSKLDSLEGVAKGLVRVLAKGIEVVLDSSTEQDCVLRDDGDTACASRERGQTLGDNNATRGGGD